MRNKPLPKRPVARFAPRAVLAIAAFLVVTLPAVAEELPPDPLKSVMWDEMATRHFPGGEIVFDQRVKVLVPESAENQMQVPVTVDARGLHGVEEIVVVADLNPITRVLSFKPSRAEPYIAFRLKLEQASPVRAGVRTSDGVWHLGGRIVDAAGGGCTAPAAAHATANWTATLGQTRALVRRIDADTLKMNVRMEHPMDTGLADGIPVFYMRDMTVKTGETKLATLQLFEPVSEDPTLSLMPKIGAGDMALDVSARDTEGNGYAFTLAVPPKGAL